jgi:predicted permease
MGLNVVALFMILFSVIVIVLGIVKVHEYPGVVAKKRNHPQHDAIVVCSLMGLIIFPLWMFALLWAYGGVIGVPLPDPAATEAQDPESEDRAGATPDAASPAAKA